MQDSRGVLGRAVLIAVAFSLLIPAAGQAKRNVYVTHFASSNVAAFDVAGSGALTPLAGSPFAAGPTALGVALSPDGKHLYVAAANWQQRHPPSASLPTAALTPDRRFAVREPGRRDRRRRWPLMASTST